MELSWYTIFTIVNVSVVVLMWLLIIAAMWWEIRCSRKR